MPYRAVGVITLKIALTAGTCHIGLFVQSNFLLTTVTIICTRSSLSHLMFRALYADFCVYCWGVE